MAGHLVMQLMPAITSDAFSAPGVQSTRSYQILFESPIVLSFDVIEAILVAGIAGAVLGQWSVQIQQSLHII
jgi:hypothetical protein